ncbi:hypothetical protein BKA65DRAFT_292979 [Rhexocercosporidium sp. MPI-PUGE-AT-0058]|nr:hypothetical protein BKA65DRAFT_292979 [Rhexocercosporidium sp. MPI-PUGE-AT-0058]
MVPTCMHKYGDGLMALTYELLLSYLLLVTHLSSIHRSAANVPRKLYRGASESYNNAKDSPLRQTDHVGSRICIHNLCQSLHFIIAFQPTSLPRKWAVRAGWLTGWLSGCLAVLRELGKIPIRPPLHLCP